MLEVLVAVAVMAVGLVAVVSVFPFSIKTNKNAELTSLASSYARTKLEQALTSAYDELAVGTTEPRARVSLDPANPAYVIERETVVSLLDGNFNPTGSDVGLKKITVTMYWPNRQGGYHTLVLASLTSRK